MLKFGLKLFNINTPMITDAQKLYEQNIFNYIELYIIPNSYNLNIELWSLVEMPFIIHAPHYREGMNLSVKSCFKNNMKLAEESIKYANKLNSEIIIFHPGIGGKIEETANQLKKINDKRIVIENKPFYGLNNELCVGYSVEEIKYVIEDVKCGFCLDIGHAICSANKQGIDQIVYIEKFIDLKPKLFHLTDGDYNSVYDSHYNFGKGNFPIKEIISRIPNGSMITNEAKRNFNDDLQDFAKDIKYLKEECKL